VIVIFHKLKQNRQKRDNDVVRVRTCSQIASL